MIFEVPNEILARIVAGRSYCFGGNVKTVQTKRTVIQTRRE
jgi:hypothetical protein